MAALQQRAVGREGVWGVWSEGQMQTGGEVNIYSEYAGCRWGYVPREVRTSHRPTSECQWHVTAGLLDRALRRRVPPC